MFYRSKDNRMRNLINSENVLEIQRQALSSIILILGLAAYLWLTSMVWPVVGRKVSPFEWAGSLLLVAGTFAGYRLRLYSVPAAFWVVILSVDASIALAVFAYQAGSLIYLFILPVLFAGVFYNPRRIFFNTFLAILLAVLLNHYALHQPWFSAQLPEQLFILSTAGVASWLSSRNLFEALAWVRTSYDQAYQNEQLVRQQQGELVRTLKALDSASHQMERLNHFLMIERDRAEEAWRLKQRFAQNISHELRTPLSIIVGFAELMIHSPEYYGASLPPQYVRDLTTIYRNAKHLQSMTNDVLELAGIDAAQITLSLSKVDPADLARDAVNTVRSLVENRGLYLHLETAANLPQVWLDPTRIRQVLFNLLNNAARFTDQGGITVCVDADTREVRFTVRDTGVGLSEEDSRRIFQEFEQVRGKGENRGGTGLGLAISQRFVELHGGHIWVESQPGAGSAFTFSLPIAGRDYSSLYRQLEERNQQAKAVSQAERKPVLLLVASDPVISMLLSRRMTNVQVVTLQSQQSAEEALTQVLPQVVLVDTANQEAAQVDWEEKVKTAGLDIPVIRCTMSTESSLKKQLYGAEYLIKPVGQAEILDTLRRFGDGVQRILVADDDYDFVQFVRRVIESNKIRHYQVFTASNGKEILEILALQPVDLLMIDLMMPGMNGQETIRHIRANPAWQGVQIVVISGNYDAEPERVFPGPLLLTGQKGLYPKTVIKMLEDLLILDPD